MRNQHRKLAKGVGVFAVAIALAAVFSMNGPQPALSGTTSSLASSPLSYADLAEAVQESVVNISTIQVIQAGKKSPLPGRRSPFQGFFGDEFFKHFFGNMPRERMKTHALGSGFVIDSSGLIVTNNHVVEKATEIKVKLRDDHAYDAKILGRDSKTDLALLKVTPDSHFPKALKLGDSDAIRVGDRVIAVGNPFGLGHTITEGIISAKGRIIGAGPYDDFLQTDAAINPGNSGGPLFDLEGEVIGINTAIVARGQGIGFAIPINIAKELLPQLKSGNITRGWLGVMIQEITPELAKSFGLESHSGALVADAVTDGPAASAGIERGDVMVAFAGKPVKDPHALSRIVAATEPGTKVLVKVVRHGKTKQVTVKIGTMPQEASLAEPVEKTASWGMRVQAITPELAERLELSPKTKGVVITDLASGSSAAESGLRPGDVIVEVNRTRVENLNGYRQALAKANADEGLLLLVERSGRSFYTVLAPTDQG